MTLNYITLNNFRDNSDGARCDLDKIYTIKIHKIIKDALSRHVMAELQEIFLGINCFSFTFE